MKKSTINKGLLVKILFPALLLFILYVFFSDGIFADPFEPAATIVQATPIPSPVTTPAPSPSPTAEPTPTPEPTPEPFQEYDIKLMALGDNLMHMNVINTGKQKDGSYDFSFLYEDLREFIDLADIRVTNQETILGGNSLGFSDYPKFNSPTEIGDAIAAAGFNVVLHATNHAFDKGLEGIVHCADFWSRYPEVLMVGISGEEPGPQIPLLTIGDITFAVLNYTYGPNLPTLPSDLRGHLNMLCDYDQDTGAINFTRLNPQVVEDIKEAKQLADVVLVFPHWGTEYTTSPSKYQKIFAYEIAEAGADLIIGTHPHAPQPVEWITTEDGRQTLCFYSLGNYVSGQNRFICMLEELAWVTFHVTEDRIYIDAERSGALPLVCHYRKSSMYVEGVYPLEDYTEEQALQHGILYVYDIPFHLEDLQTTAQEVLGDSLLSKSDILAP